MITFFGKVTITESLLLHEIWVTIDGTWEQNSLSLNKPGWWAEKFSHRVEEKSLTYQNK